MKAHTNGFKEQIKLLGKEIDSKITYTLNEEEIELGNEQLNSVSVHYEGAILKSVMKQLDIDSNIEIPVGTILTYQFGLKVSSEYEYINYGNFVVKSVEKQEDTNSYKITCYDKMLYSMKDYDNIGIRYPLTIKDYLLAICEKIGLEYEGSQFANQDKIIQNELYLDADGRSMSYTFRDVLDELAEVTGGTICINNDDKLEVRYIHDVGELQNVSGASLTLETNEEAELQNFELEGKTMQDSEPSPENPSSINSVGYQNLNFMPYKDGTSKTTNSLVFTVDSNGKTVVNGTPTANSYFYYHTHDATPYLNISKGIYFLNGCPEGGANNKYYIALRLYNDTTYVTSFYDYGAGTIVDTTSYDYNRILLFIYVNSGIVCDNLTFKAQITKGTQAHSYIPYDKYGIEVKSTGKNLLDLSQFTTQKINGVTFTKNEDSSITLNGTASNTITLNVPITIIPLQNDISYTLSQGTTYASANYSISLRQQNNSVVGTVGVDSGLNSLTYNLATATQAHFFRIYVVNGKTFNNHIIYPMLERNTQATNYEEYKENTYLYQLDNPLRSIGDVKDLLYIKNGYLYVDRKIGSVVLNGTENWETQWSGSNIHAWRTSVDNLKNTTATSQNSYVLSDYYTPYSQDNLFNNYSYGICNRANQSQIIIRNNDFTSTNDFKTWLSTNNTEVQYILAESYIETLGEVQMPSTYAGITYIDTSATMNVSYISEIEEINEEYLKDVNVKFGGKFGKVNTVVLSRGGDGDKISLSIPENLADEDKIALQITDNQIMNDNDRDTYMSEILNKLYGLEYYINDFTSTGICYLELCDRYNIKIGDNTYKCIMFNDEINITQGLQELIYTDMQEENEQQYKYISSTDKGITQANIIAKKNEGVIEEYTQRLDDTNGRIDSVETKQTSTDRTISVISQNITYQYDETGQPISSEVNAVTTKEKRFTLNDSGLNISSSDNTFTARMDEQGVFFEDGSSRVAEYTKDGSKQKDLQLFGVYYYGMADINDTPMFVAQLYEDNNGEECIGHFWNSGDY